MVMGKNQLNFRKIEKIKLRGFVSWGRGGKKMYCLESDKKEKELAFQHDL